MASRSAFIGFVKQRSSLKIFSSCTTMGPPTKLYVFANFWPKNVTTLYHSTYSPDLSPPDYFLFPKLKMKLKGLHFTDVAELQEAVTDELNKFQKEVFSAAFQKLYDRAKACTYANGAYFEFKKSVFLICLRFLKKSVLQLLHRTVYKLAFKMKKLQMSVDNSVHSVSIKCIKTFSKSS